MSVSRARLRSSLDPIVTHARGDSPVRLDFARIDDAGQSLVWAMVLMTGLVLVTWKILPRTRFYGWTVAQGTQQVEDGYTVQTAEAVLEAIGQQGIAQSYLRPSGRGRFNDKNYDVVTRGEFLAKGTPIVIIQAEGNRYVVTELKEES